MICQRCLKASSVVSIGKVINGKKIEIMCCEECARAVSEVDFDTPFSSADIVESVLESVSRSPIKVNYVLVTKCGTCGMTYRDFREIRRLGCPDCYQSFGEKLMPLIKNAHGHVRHAGKTPSRDADERLEITRLKSELQKAVDMEAYEVAADIRDRIRALESVVDVRG